MQNKDSEKSSFDKVREKYFDPRTESRLNYRDETSGAIGAAGAGDTTFGKHWNNRKYLRKKFNKKQKNKVS